MSTLIRGWTLNYLFKVRSAETRRTRSSAIGERFDRFEDNIVWDMSRWRVRLRGHCRRRDLRMLLEQAAVMFMRWLNNAFR